ncbi:MAG: MFS transporter [Dehalococcoidia bacterium]
MDDLEAAGTARPPLTARLANSAAFSSLSVPSFRFLLAGTAFSQVASWMEEVARGWLVLQLTDSPFQLGLFGFIRGSSSLVVSPVAGVLADRLDRRRLAAISQAVPGLMALVIAVLVVTDQIALWHLYVSVTIAGVTNAVNFPTRQVLVYDTVGSQHLTNAIALNSVTANVARIVAPSVGGVLIGTVGVGASYYAQTAFFALATVSTLMLRPMTQVEPVRVPMWQAMRDGVAYVRANPTVLRLVLLNVVPNVLIYPYVAMMPIFAKEILGVGSVGYGVLLSAVGFGSIPGGLMVASMSGSRWKGRIMGGAALLYMAMVACFALSSWFGLSFAILVIGGLGWSMMVTLNQTLLQLNVAEDFRGRVISLYTMANGLSPFGSLALGAASARFGVQEAVVAFALTGFALAAYLGLGSARVRRL